MSNQGEFRILIVDDERDLRELFSFELEAAGYEVIVAPNGDVAYEMLLSMRIDLVLSDLRMAGGGGLELLEKIRKRDPEHPPVILMTGSTTMTDEDCTTRGARRVLMKPFDRRTLMEAVSEALAKRRTPL